MNSQVKMHLVELIKRDEVPLCQAWESHLAHEALLASLNLTGKIYSPLRQFVGDLILTLQNESILRVDLPRSGGADWLDFFRGQPVGQVRAVEIFQEGERVTRQWVADRLVVTDEEMLEVYERLNLAFHALLRFYVSEYCLHCRVEITPELSTASRRTS